jgi:anti-sigma B factor antagonist
MPLTVETISQPNGAVVVQVTGALTIGRESQRVETVLEGLISSGLKRIVLDLGGVDYMDSTGVGIVTFCLGRLNEVGGTLRVARAPGRIREVFRITAVDRLVPFDDSLDSAVAAA